MYELHKVPLGELLPYKQQHHQPSEKALRARANEGILAYIGMNGSAKLYDLHLSLVRCEAAHLARDELSGAGRVPWNTIAKLVSSMDLPSAHRELTPASTLNEWIVQELNKESSGGVPYESVAERLSALIRRKFSG